MHIDDVIATSKRATRSVKVSIRGDLLDEADRLEDELQQAIEDDKRLNRKPEAPAIAQRIEELKAQADDETVTFRFQAIGQKAWSDLMRKHPPTKDQQKAYGRLDYDPETFPVAAVAASCVEPEGVDEDKASRLLETWNFSQWNRLWSACLAVNVGDTSVPFSASASAVLGLLEQKPTTPSQEGSPDDGS